MKRSRTFRFLFMPGVILLLATLAGCEKKSVVRVKTEIVKVDSLDQIVLVANPQVKPLLYTHVYGLEKLPVRKAKAKFISAVLPSILVAKYQIEQIRKDILTLQKKELWTKEDSAHFFEVRNRYRAKDADDLLMRMRTLPTSIVLAQAAVESGWGKSRFFLEANNLFGVWSYNPLEPRIPARRTRGNKTIYLRSYPDMSHSIVHYFEILARSRPYKSLRKARLETDDPFTLLPHLKNYSERRTAYTDQLKKIIINNNLTQFDRYEIDPSYIVQD